MEIFISVAAAAVGAAYLLGVVFDRFGDTLLDGIARQQEKHFYEREKTSPEDADWKTHARRRMHLLKISETSGEWHDYLRSRLRLSRSLAVYLPGLTFAGVLALRPELPRVWLMLLALAYGMAFGFAKVRAAPQVLAGIFGLFTLLLAWCTAGQIVQVSLWAACVPHPRLALDRATSDVAFLVTVAGVVLSALSAWAWWRINQTYLRFLANFEQFTKEAAASTVRTPPTPPAQ